MPQPKILTYSLTVNVTGDLPEPVISDIAGLIRSHSSQCYVITEVASQLHLHACWLSNGSPQTSSNYFRNFKPLITQILDKHGCAYNAKAAIKLKTWYNIDFLDNYCQKDPNRVVILDSITDREALSQALSLTPDAKIREPTVYNKQLVSMAQACMQYFYNMSSTIPDYFRITPQLVEQWYLQQCLCQKLAYIKDPRRRQQEIDAIFFFADNGHDGSHGN